MYLPIEWTFWLLEGGRFMFVLKSSPDDLVGSSICKWSGGEADSFVGGVKHRVEALEEGETVDEVKTLSARSTQVVCDEIDVSSNSANVGVESTGPQLSIWCQCECRLLDYESVPRSIILEMNVLHQL